MKRLKKIRIHCSSFQSRLLLAFFAATLLPISIIEAFPGIFPMG